MTGLVVAAPMRGWVVALADVPDPAFAGGMIGDGAAIDPLDGTVCAPCDGTVTSVAKGRHAVTLLSANGAEILVHVGIDTVAARGTGLIVRVEPGQRVRQGDALIDVSLDELLDHAASLVTPVVIANAAGFSFGRRRQTGLVERGEPLFELTPSSAGVADGRAELAGTGDGADASEDIRVALPHGVHARPAAEIVRLSRRYSSRIALVADGRRAEARSMTALLGLGAAHGDRVRVEASGPDARDAVRAVASILATASMEPAKPAPAADTRTGTGEPDERRRPDGEGIPGIVASPGMAIGRARHLRRASITVEEKGRGIERERESLAGARRDAAARLARQAADGNDILGAQLELLEDPALVDAAIAAIERGKSAAYAWREAASGAREALAASRDSRIAERAADLRDVEEQVLLALAGVAATSLPELAPDTILLADDLLPSEFARLDLDRVSGIGCGGGGPTSHAALMAAARGIPAVVGLGRALRGIEDGTELLLDAERGVLVPEPPGPAVERARASIAAGRKARAANLADAREEAVTADGVKIELFANLASESEARHAVELGAEGCGLLRTELLYLDRREAPGEDEQAALYQAIAHALGNRPLVIRTLDVGGDKPLPFLPLPAEENPLLGLRGLRASLAFPRVLEAQLRAIARIEPRTQCRILLPMVTEPGEIRGVRRMLAELEAGRTDGPAMLPVGAMIETPASVALADAIAREADFLSIGSNDLAQYTLAMDRTHPALAARFDYLHPAVLRQIAAVCEAGRKASRSVSVCGALASEPAAVPVLIGLGVRTLSAVPSAVPSLKALVRRLTVRDCQRLAARVLEQEDAASARRVAGAFAPVSAEAAAPVSTRGAAS